MALVGLFLTTFVPASAHGAPFMKGIALGLYFENEGLRFETMVDEIKAAGATHIELVVQWVQQDLHSTDLGPDRLETTPDARLREVIRHARGRGLQVVLLPIVHLRMRAQGEWRGKLAPHDWNAWWKAYRAFIGHYAKLAQDEGVAVLSVGSELVTTEAMYARWQRVIGEVKAVFEGKLLYSANWDHYEPVSFWDLVDYAGLTGYYKLTDNPAATVDELTTAWTAVRAELRNFHAKVRRPLVFTELGYPSQDGAASHPWDYTTGKAVDLEEQRRCYEAVRRVWQGERMLGGLFWWNWFGYGGPDSAYYTPNKKPAQSVIRRWYLGQTPPSR